MELSKAIRAKEILAKMDKYLKDVEILTAFTKSAYICQLDGMMRREEVCELGKEEVKLIIDSLNSRINELEKELEEL